MTPDQITLQLQDARKRAVQGDLAGALSLCEVVVRSNRDHQPAFQMYRRLYNAVHGRDVPHAAVFDFIYASNAWHIGSGFGSLPQATETYRPFLQDFLARHAIRSVVDAGCGDWQSSRLIDWSGIDYLGIDVSSIVLKNIVGHAAPNIRFAEGDIRTLEQPGADLLIMKDVLQHWSNADIQALIPKFARYRYCLITNGTSAEVQPNLNQDIPAGHWRPVDLALPPFSVAGEYVHAYDFTVNLGNGQVSQEHKRVFLVRGQV
jgi:SAM-dependent methyltransferase